MTARKWGARLEECARLFLALCFLTLAAPATSEPPAISLTLTPQVGYTPLTVDARVRTEPHYLNVGTCITWFQLGSEFPDGKSCVIAYEGQYMPRLQFYTIKALRTGEYVVIASVIRVRDFENTPALPIRVLDRLY